MPSSDQTRRLSIPDSTGATEVVELLGRGIGALSPLHKNSLFREVEDSGFVVRDCSYRLWSLVLPVAIVHSLPYRLGGKGDQERVGRQLGHSSPVLARTLIRLDRAVSGLLPFGTSLFSTAVPK